jgi:large subunit ribosomal protein L35
MPSVKAKTHKGIKKRFKVTATGKVMHKKCGSSHLMSGKSGKAVRRLRRPRVLTNQAVSQKLRRALLKHEVNRPVEPETPEVAPESGTTPTP